VDFVARTRTIVMRARGVMRKIISVVIITRLKKYYSRMV